MTNPGALRLASWFSTRIITHPQELKAIHRLRYRVYCKERGFLPAGDYPAGMERDAFDASAAHFAAFDQDDRVAAAVRLVRPLAGTGLPFQHHCELFEPVDMPGMSDAAEVSRLVLNRGYRTPPGGGCTGTVVMAVYREMYRYSREHGIRYWYAVMERPLLRMLRRIGVEFECIGPEVDFGGPVAPYLLELSELEKRWARCNPELLRWFSSAL